MSIEPQPALEKLLTDRELEILQMMVRGLTNQEITLWLNMSHSTVKHHVTNVIAKLKVKSRAQAVVRDVGSGIKPSRP